jgi:hypothetical protein
MHEKPFCLVITVNVLQVFVFVERSVRLFVPVSAVHYRTALWPVRRHPSIQPSILLLLRKWRARALV